MPGLFKWPLMQKTFGSGDSFVPIEPHQSAPRFIICDTLTRVSTLLTTVGIANAPCVAMYGGRTLNWPRLPSSDSMSAEASPHIYAPAPLCTARSNEKSVPFMFLPRKLRLYACSIAAFIILYPSGYSPRRYMYPPDAPI